MGDSNYKLTGFTHLKCPRCGGKLYAWIMSKFNEEKICPDCHDRELSHPLYAEADRAESAAVNAGNFNFKGIGAPRDLYQPERTKPE